MVRYDSEQQVVIRDLFERLNDEEIPYVIPRGYRDLPDSVPGADVDFLVHADHYDRVAEIAIAQGFGPLVSQFERTLGMAQKAIRNPRKAAETVLDSPKRAARLASGQKYSTSIALRRGYEEAQKENDGVTIHFFNHLAYKSTMNERKVRVDPSVENGMLSRREFDSIFAAPSPPDELAHLVCRGVFDKGGDFPDYYVETCDELWAEIQREDEYRSVLDELLSELFFDADVVVHDAIQNREYDDLRDELLRFSDY